MIDLDLSLAVQAMRTLRFESHNYQECNELVWRPTQFWLEILCAEKPHEILCLHSAPRKKNGFDANIFAVGPQNKVMYLGTVIDQKRAEYYFRVFPQILQRFTEKVREIRCRGPMAIMRWWVMCSIPVACAGLAEKDIGTGVKKYLAKFAPQLSKTPISWMPQKQQEEIYLEILRQAKSTATPQTDEERKQKFLSDLIY